MATYSEYQKFLEKEYNRLYREQLMSLLSMLASGESPEGGTLLRINELKSTMEQRKYAIQYRMSEEMQNYFNQSKFQTATLLKKRMGPTPIRLTERAIQRSALDSLLREKKDVLNRQFGYMLKDMKNDFNNLDKFMTLVNAARDVEGGSYFIGRRIIDDIRNVGLNNIEQKLITGASWNKTEKAIFNDLAKLGKTGRIIVGEPVKYERYVGKAKIVDFPIKINTFSKLDNPDNFYFRLRTKSGKLAWYNAKDYSNLVSITTAREASWAGEIEGSVSVGNYLVAFNFFGVNYAQIGDPCSRIDGQIFSLKRGYVATNGMIYPYLFDTLPKKPYLLPHPRCRHTMGSIIDNVRVLERYDTIAAKNKFGMKPITEAA